MYKKVVNVLEITKKLISENVIEGSVVVDATVGKGNDTLKLSTAAGKTGRVYGFDIQDLAIAKTKERLDEIKAENVILIKDGHEKIDQYVKEEIDFCIYNLGYLPTGDKNLITKGKTTIESIKKSLQLLKPNGLIVIVCYIGHDGGDLEEELVSQLLADLDQKEFNVMKNEFINQKNKPPLVYIVEKNL